MHFRRGQQAPIAFSSGESGPLGSFDYSSQTACWSGQPFLCSLSQSLAVLCNGAGHAPLLPQTRVFHVEVTDSCMPFILFAPSILWSVLRCVYVGPLVVCLSLCTYLFAVLWWITAAAARHAGRVNFDPTAMRSNVVVTICTCLLRRGAIYEHCRDRLQLPVERCR